MTPGIIASAALAFVESWGEYLYAAVLLNSPDKLTASVLVGQLATSEFGYEWGLLAAASLLSSIPPLAFIGIATSALPRLGSRT